MLYFFHRVVLCVRGYEVEERTLLSSSSRRLLVKMSASFLREMASSSASSDVYSALVSVLKSTLTLSWYQIIVPTPKGYEASLIEGEPSEDLTPYLDWIVSKKSPAFIHSDDGVAILLLPLVFKDQVKGIFAGGLAGTEVDVELQESLQIFSYLAASTLVNIELSESLAEKNKIIEESWNFLKGLLDSFPDQIVVYDNEGVAIFKNQAFDTQKMPPSCLTTLEQMLKSVALTKQTVSKEVECENERFYSIEVMPLSFGENDYLLVRIDDITGTKELERLKKIDQMKTEFVANISHEIRTPLAAIKAYAETLKDSIEDLDTETLSDFVNTIAEQTLHLEGIVEELLDFSRVELGQLQLERSETDLVSLVKNTIASLEKLAQERGVELRTHFDSASVTVSLDPHQFRKVITNLLSNAIKYSDPSKARKWVEVEVTTDEDNAILVVSDNGIGMGEEEKTRAFERFYRADSSLTYEVSGTGLGLSIAKEIVEAHGGSVEIESEKGVGTTVRVVVPK